MAIRRREKERRRLLPGAVESGLRRLVLGTYGLVIVAAACAAWASLATWSVHDPSLNNATRAAPRNLLGSWGAVVADLAIQSLGVRLDHPVFAAGRLGLASRLPHEADPRRKTGFSLGLPRCSCSRRAGGVAAAEELAAAQRAWRHPRRFLHGRRPCHRTVPARRRRSPSSPASPSS